jgi:hypothetical protein
VIRPACRALVAPLLLLAFEARASCDPARLLADAPGVFDGRLPEPASEALARIPEFGRMLLAARAYLRAGAKLAARWSWDEARIAAFEGSPEQRRLLDDIARVRAAFEASNPGLSLYVHATLRSLDRQIEAWNENASVGHSAEALLVALSASGLACRDDEEPTSDDAFGAWLANWAPSPKPNLAAPGLSPHGQARAIDFQVATRDGRIVAAADSSQVAAVWRAGGWDQRLAAAVSASGAPFLGPLASPDEPWHYEHQLASPAEVVAEPSGGSPPRGDLP